MQSIIPPHSIEAEQSVLWSILFDSGWLIEIIDTLKKSDFYSESNATIYEVIMDLYRVWRPIDLITLKEELEKRKLLVAVWWISYLTELTSIVPYSVNIAEYTYIVKEKSGLRKILLLTQIIQKQISEEKDISGIIWDIHSTITKIEENIFDDETMADVYERTLDYIENIKKQELVGISYWKEFKFLDIFTGWIQPGNIIRIWGGSNVWKTWLMLNFLLEIIEHDEAVTFFSLENSDSFTMKNIFWLKKWTNSLPEAIKKNNSKFDEQAEYFFNKPNFFLDTKVRSLQEIFRKTLKNKSKYIFIDYIQLVRTEWKTKNDRLTEYAFAIQEFAQKNKITVFDLSQLSNESNRWWVDGYASTEFYGASELKSSCDVWIHIFENKDKMEMKRQCIESWDNRDYFKNFVKIKITKNRLWAWVGTIKNFYIDFSKWGIFLWEENNF